MDTHEQEALKVLIQELAKLINVILGRSPDLQSAVRKIEDRGYHVDIVLASMTSVIKKEPPELLDVRRTDFDKEFLKNLRIRLDADPNP